MRAVYTCRGEMGKNIYRSWSSFLIYLICLKWKEFEIITLLQTSPYVLYHFSAKVSSLIHFFMGTIDLSNRKIITYDLIKQRVSIKYVNVL